VLTLRLLEARARNPSRASALSVNHLSSPPGRATTGPLLDRYVRIDLIEAGDDLLFWLAGDFRPWL